MKMKKLQQIIWAVVIVSIILGVFLGIYIEGNATSEYRYDIAIPMVGGAILGFVIWLFFSKLNKKRNGNVPEVDERKVMLMQRYFMIVLYVILCGSGVALLTLYSMGVHFIETGMLIICMMGIYMMIGFGAIITKRL
ncbi:hypothetical protein MHI18_03325 [Peribacillus sp. FSL H8-0477]|uniref:hypothetical protein n=1 Tax=Peribacillus sp. FSL H8-0477 TaxID=2921388 RepID=UPI0030FCBE20